MRLALLLAVGFASFATAAPIPKEPPTAKVPNYFPCELYTKWGLCTPNPFCTTVRRTAQRMIATSILACLRGAS